MILKLAVIDDKTRIEIPLLVPKCIIGRDDGCLIRIDSELVGGRHCMISVDNGSATIEDCGSDRGTLVNGERIVQRHDLKDGDRITIGPRELEVRWSTYVLPENNVDGETAEWEGWDLLLLASVGGLLVVVLSWLFPEGRMGGWSEWVSWYVGSWQNTWWLRCGVGGLLAALVVTLFALFRIRARSQQGR